MSGFEGIGDFDSDDPFERYAAHQAAKGWAVAGGQARPFTVVDTAVEPGENTPIIGRFRTEEEASKFIETLPDAESGRYGLDGPPE